MSLQQTLSIGDTCRGAEQGRRADPWGHLQWRTAPKVLFPIRAVAFGCCVATFLGAPAGEQLSSRQPYESHKSSCFFQISLTQTGADLSSRICMTKGSQNPGQMGSWRRPLSQAQGWGMEVLHAVQVWLSPNTPKYLPFLEDVRSCIQIQLQKSTHRAFWSF